MVPFIIHCPITMETTSLLYVAKRYSLLTMKRWMDDKDYWAEMQQQACELENRHWFLLARRGLSFGSYFSFSTQPTCFNMVNIPSSFIPSCHVLGAYIDGYAMFRISYSDVKRRLPRCCVNISAPLPRLNENWIENESDWSDKKRSLLPILKSLPKQIKW